MTFDTKLRWLYLKWNKNNDKVLSLLEACFDLISGSSPYLKIQIMGGKITENEGFKSPLRKIKKILAFFSFHFQILHKECKKGLKSKYPLFCEEFEYEKKEKKIDLPERGFEL